MAAAATAVLLSTRTDVRVSGRHREAALSFFAAEAGIAYAKSYLSQQWGGATFWTSTLGKPPTVTTYTVGGIQVGSETLPQLNSRYTFTIANNNADPSGDPLIDQDGIVVVTSVGVALDRSGNKVLAETTVQVEVQWSSVSISKGDYSAMQGQSASGVTGSPDSAAVNMGSRRSF
jgi:hypothetical protein